MTETDIKKFQMEMIMSSLFSNGNTRKEIPSKDFSLMKLSTYFIALRPWSLSASLMPTLLGATIAYKYPGNTDFSYLNLVITVLTVVSVHGAGNLVNTYNDFVKGIDNRKSDDRILVDEILTKDEVARLGQFLYFIGFVGFGLLAVLSPVAINHLAFVFFAGLSASFLYSGALGFKYHGLGDIITFITFGPLSVLFAFMVQTGRLESAMIYYAIPLALNTEAILHSNNTRDLENDRAAGIVTLAILIGYTASHILYAFLLFTPYIMFTVFSLKYSIWFMLPLITLPQGFKIEKQFRLSNVHSVPKKTAKLNLYFGILYVLACSFTTELPFISKS